MAFILGLLVRKFLHYRTIKNPNLEGEKLSRVFLIMEELTFQSVSHPDYEYCKYVIIKLTTKVK